MSPYRRRRSPRRRTLIAAGVAAVTLVLGSVFAVQAFGAVSQFSTTRNGVRCTGPATTAAKQLARRVQAEVGPALTAAGRRTAFAVDDTKTGLMCSARATSHFDSASIVKVAIVAALLDVRRSAGHGLSRTEQTWARAAITRSDNTAASKLWKRVGGAAAMRRFFTRADMTHTTPGAGGAWGLTQVTAADELTLLRHVTRPGLLADTDRRYLQNLMTAVIHSQRWGVPYSAPRGARVGNKNGWLHRSTAAWRVHSIGWVRLKTTTYDVVLLSDGKAGLQDGIRRLDRVAKAVHTAMGNRS